MRFSATFIALAASTLVSSAPLKRVANAQEVLVLKFAHVLEQFETQFYTQALAKFQESDFVSAGFSNAQVPIEQFTSILRDETAHTSILASTITAQGDQPITTCTFNFDAALTDVPTMAATARVVENLGVAAYLGAASLISDPVILTAAGSILTIEARHQTLLNILTGGSAVPQAFDIPFGPSEVLAVAAPFITGCDLGVPANPTLTITNTGPVAPGTTLSLSSSAINGSTDGLSCQMLVGGAPFAVVLPFNQCVVPDGINGPVALYVTSDPQPLANNVRDKATDKIVAGPTMAFIDTSPEAIAQAVRGGSPAVATGVTTTTTTETLTPAQASAILSVATSATPVSTAAPTSDAKSSTVPGSAAITVNGLTPVPANGS